MAGSRYPWSVPLAGAVLLLPAGIGGVVSASEPDPGRLVGLVSAGVAAVVAIGLLARRRWAVRAGFALVPVGVGLTLLAFRDDARAGGMMAYVTVLFLLFLLPARWRRRDRAAVTTEAEAGDPAPAGRPPTAAQWVVFVLCAVPTVLGVALFLLLLPLALSTDVLGAVPGLVAVVLFFGSGTVLLRPRRRAVSLDLARLPVDGAATPAFVAPYDRLGRAAIPAAATGTAIIGVLILVEAGTPRAVWVSAAVLGGLVAAALVAALARGWRSHVALLPSGLYAPGPRRPLFVPWESVTCGFLHLTRTRGGAVPFVAVTVSDPAAVRLSTGGRLLHLVNRPFGADVYFPAGLLAIEPEFLVQAIEVYRRSPDRRQDIGTTQELARLRSAWSGSAVP